MHREPEGLIQRLSDSWRVCLRQRLEKVVCFHQVTSADYRSRVATDVAAGEKMAKPHPCRTTRRETRLAAEGVDSGADPPLHFLCWY
jgi:hypothetical protein